MITYMALTIGIGLYLSKTNKSIQEFFVAKRGLGVALIIPLLFAELIAGAGTIGNAAEAFRMGFSSVWANWGMVVGCLVFVIFVSKFYRVVGAKFGVMSVPEAYKVLFDSKTRLIMLLIICLVYGIIFAQQPTAAASILGPMFKVDNNLMAWIVGAIFIIMTLTGGLKGLAWMNVVHSFVMYFGMGIAAFVCVNHVGGYGQLKATLPASFFSFAQPDFWTVVAWCIGTAVSFFAAATVVGVCFGAQSLKKANTGIALGGFLVLPFALMPALIGMAAKVHMPTIVAKNALFSMSAHVGPWIGGLAAMAIIAAIFSTAPALLLIVSTTLTRDFYKGIVKPEATDAEQLRFSQITILVIGIIATYLGMKASSILGQMLGAFQIRSVAGIVLVMALLWPRVNSTAAFWSTLLGGSLAAIWHFAGSPFGVAPLWPSAAVGLVTLFLLTLLSKEPVSEGYKRYQTALKEAETDGTI
ncbi:MAG: sodium:solute symporter family protein [Firmicutes bacterium]|nr:sodium:solute symporter family protein [Bacillota bacterium]